MSTKDINPQLKEKISILPETPGVYTYYDRSGMVIYVGKAKNLKRRVSSYFNRTHPCLRTNLLVAAIADMSYIVVPTEQDALNLENSLIKEHRPRYNVLLKDDKSYPWIAVTDELYPRAFVTRSYVKNGWKYYGPYTTPGVAYTLVQLLSEIYPLRTCRLNINSDYLAKGKGHLCLNYHIKRCRGCCIGAISAEEYGQYIGQIRQILRGDIASIMQYLRDEMTRLASELKFEEAQALKEKYQKMSNYQSRSVIVSQTIDELDVFGLDDEGDKDVYVNYMHVRRGAVVKSVTLHYRRSLDESPEQLLSYAIDEIKTTFGANAKEIVCGYVPEVEMPSRTITIPQRGDRAKLLDVSVHNARQARVDALKHLEKHDPEARNERTLQRIRDDFRLKEMPHHIECFDNSNIQGTNPVASCVVFRNAKPSKKEYRHFKIKTVEGPDDFASMREVLTRRYTRMLAETPEDLPQLIVVDGGKGQLSAAVEALEAIGLRGTIAVVGIAKRLEEIYFPGDSLPLYISKTSESLRVVQHLRDEAHRFGITFHRDLRSKSQIRSELDNIKGIGPATARTLLSHFRSVKRIREATLPEVAKLIGPAKAKIVKTALCGESQNPITEASEK